jgi:hypothetical protein
MMLSLSDGSSRFVDDETNSLSCPRCRMKNDESPKTEEPAMHDLPEETTREFET